MCERMSFARSSGIRILIGVALLLVSLYVLLGPPSPAPIFQLATVQFGPAGIEGISEQVAIRLFTGLALLVAAVWLIIGRIA